MSQLHRPQVGEKDPGEEVALQGDTPAMVKEKLKINGDIEEQRHRGSTAPLELQGLNDNGQGVEQVLRNLQPRAEEQAQEDKPMVVEAAVEKAQALHRAKDENEMRRREQSKSCAGRQLERGSQRGRDRMRGA